MIEAYIPSSPRAFLKWRLEWGYGMFHVQVPKWTHNKKKKKEKKILSHKKSPSLPTNMELNFSAHDHHLGITQGPQWGLLVHLVAARI